MVKYSIVVPVYNEEASLNDLFTELSAVMRSLEGSYEIIFVNDCSRDSTPSLLKVFNKNNPGVVKVFDLLKRSGQTFAIRQGLNQAQGEIVITLDADLQNDPADIPRLIEKMKEGFDVVCGWRLSRKDTPLKAMLSKSGNFLQRRITGMRIHDVSCTLRAYKKACVSKIPLNWEGQHRFMPLSLSLQGYKVGEIISNHRLRRFGYTKYSNKRIFRVVVDFFKILKSKGNY